MKKVILPLLLSPFMLVAQPMSFSELTLNRYSPKEFDSAREFSDREISIIANDVRNSPSSYNQQPWVYILFDKKQAPENFEKVLSCLAGKNKEWAKDAPLLILCLANSISDFDNKPNPYAEYDTGCASGTLSYSATSIGAQAHQMGGFDPEKARNLFNIPARYKPMTVIALGFTKNKVAPIKNRKPINQMFYIENLDRGFEIK